MQDTVVDKEKDKHTHSTPCIQFKMEKKISRTVMHLDILHPGGHS